MEKEFHHVPAALNVLLFGSVCRVGAISVRCAATGTNLPGCFTIRTRNLRLPSVQDECRRNSIPARLIQGRRREFAPGMNARPDVVLSRLFLPSEDRDAVPGAWGRSGFNVARRNCRGSAGIFRTLGRY